MRKDRFQALLKTTHDRMVELTATKGQEYTNNSPTGATVTQAQIDAQDQHANFRRDAEELGFTPEQALGIALNKHMNAVKSFIKHGRVFSEPIEGRIDDAILYLILLKGLTIERVEKDYRP